MSLLIHLLTFLFVLPAPSIETYTVYLSGDSSLGITDSISLVDIHATDSLIVKDSNKAAVQLESFVYSCRCKNKGLSVQLKNVGPKINKRILANLRSLEEDCQLWFDITVPGKVIVKYYRTLIR